MNPILACKDTNYFVSVIEITNNTLYWPHRESLLLTSLRELTTSLIANTHSSLSLIANTPLALASSRKPTLALASSRAQTRDLLSERVTISLRRWRVKPAMRLKTRVIPSFPRKTQSNHAKSQ